MISSHWIFPKKKHEISIYRLGDLIMLNNLCEYEENQILKDYPNSIATKYILEKRINTENNIDIITKIVLEYMEHISIFLPKDISNSTVIHVRLGDVVAGNTWHEKEKRPLEIDYIKSLLINDNNKKYIIGKCFFAIYSSTNYEECIHASNSYLQNMLNELNAEHFNSGNADIDLCCAIKSKIFIQGKGYFSKLIVEIRKKLNLISVEINNVK
jgi:hypothetical protein